MITNLEFKEYEDITDSESGTRFYKIDDHLYPSVTTFLKATNPKQEKGLKEWRDRVGNEEADKISLYARSRGTALHQLFEDRFSGKQPSFEGVGDHVVRMYHESRRNLDRITDVVAIEKVLYSHKLKLAGRVDCIGYWDGKLAIIDFKTSTKSKIDKWITDYKLQTSIYSMMFYEMFGIKIDKYVIFIATEAIGPQIFQGFCNDHTFDVGKRLKVYYSKC